MQSKGYIRYADLPLETSDGRRIDAEFVSNVYLVDHERVIQCNIRDITARKRAEEALQQRTAELEARNEELDDFSHTVAHDLQGLVSLVTGYAKVLAEDHTGFSGEELERCLYAVLHNGRKVWVNYIGNAIQYGGRPPRVEMGAEAQPDGMVRFWVQDNGSGLMPEARARLFVPFTQLAHLHGKGHGPGIRAFWQCTQ